MQTTSKYMDETLQCMECSQDFVFTAGEQHFYFDLRGWKTRPGRCDECRRREGNRSRHLRGPRAVRKALQLADRIAAHDETLVTPASLILRQAIGVLSRSPEERAVEAIETLTLSLAKSFAQRCRLNAQRQETNGEVQANG